MLNSLLFGTKLVSSYLDSRAGQVAWWLLGLDTGVSGDSAQMWAKGRCVGVQEAGTFPPALGLSNTLFARALQTLGVCTMRHYNKYHLVKSEVSSSRLNKERNYEIACTLIIGIEMYRGTWSACVCQLQMALLLCLYDVFNEELLFC